MSVLDELLGKVGCPYSWDELREMGFDTDVLAQQFELCDGDPSFLFSIFRVYLDLTPDLLKKIHVALAENNARTVVEVAHRLKGSSATVGLRVMRESCSAIEICAKNGDLKTASTHLSEFEKSYRELPSLLMSGMRLGKST